jgi:hypothetical protein
MSIVLLGSTSGSCTLQEQAVAGTTTLTLPTFNGTVGLLVSGTVNAGGANPFNNTLSSIDFTSIPAGVRRITVMLSGVSTSGTSAPIIQLGDSGGVENTSYISTAIGIQTSTAVAANSTAGFLVVTPTMYAASSTISGSVSITTLSTNLWVVAGATSREAGSTTGFSTAGSKSLSDTLDRIRITTVGGTDTFDAGSINILYE